MTTRRSRKGARIHSTWQCAQSYNEPPTTRSVPAADAVQGPEDEWGHHMGKKQPGTIRFMLQNVDGIPTHEDGDLKLDCLNQFTKKHQIDIITLTELNTAWDKLPYTARLPSKTRGWWEACHWSISHNKKDQHGDSFQPGGTAIAAVNAWAHRTTTPGDDSSGLGRWSWIRIRGRDNHFLRVVAVYRPCKSNGHLTTYQQQVRGLAKSGCLLCPKEKLLEDLKEQVLLWRSEGDSVIIMADMNDDVRYNPILETTTCLGMKEAITTQHGTAGPNTHNRGSTPIDGIFLPENLLQNLQSGYLAFGEGIPSDHRLLWVDIPIAALDWLAPPDAIPLKARRLKCEDPRIVERYTQELQRLLQQQQLPDRLQALAITITGTKLT